MDTIDLKGKLSALGWSQKTFAVRLQCDQDTVSRWCTGKTPVPGWVSEYLRVCELAREMLA
jgi:transcriptional regulator with XRE-family HTH domain